jgi:3-dehydroquinate dehydratase-2
VKLSTTDILVLHGPNLNLLGKREPAIYGHTSLNDINERLHTLAKTLGFTLQIEQRNSEHELIELIHKNEGKRLVIFNPAAFTHTSVALRDSLTGTETRFIEVHLSNIYGREPFRQHSYFSDIALAVIVGCGAKGYEFALEAAKELSRSK